MKDAGDYAAAGHAEGSMKGTKASCSEETDIQEEEEQEDSEKVLYPYPCLSDLSNTGREYGNIIWEIGSEKQQDKAVR